MMAAQVLFPRLRMLRTREVPLNKQPRFWKDDIFFGALDVSAIDANGPPKHSTT
jgi:hypothetical protein